MLVVVLVVLVLVLVLGVCGAPVSQSASQQCSHHLHRTRRHLPDANIASRCCPFHPCLRYHSGAAEQVCPKANSLCGGRCRLTMLQHVKHQVVHGRCHVPVCVVRCGGADQLHQALHSRLPASHIPTLRGLAHQLHQGVLIANQRRIERPAGAAGHLGLQ
jgi:hypothetical protein